MSDLNEPRLVLVVPAWDKLRRDYENWDVDTVEAELKRRLDEAPQDPGQVGQRNLAKEFRVVALPSNAPVPPGLDIDPAEFRRMLVFGLVMTGGPEAARILAARVKAAFGAQASIGADLAVSSAQDAARFWSHWCPEEAGYGLFGDRTAALRVMHGDQTALAAAGLPGPEHANIVFVDTGLPPGLLPPQGQFRGWPVLENPADPGGPVRQPGNPLTRHGEMVARNARAVVEAPGPGANLRLLDCPAIPDGIMDLPVFLHSVTAALFTVWVVIAWLRAQEAAQQAPDRTGWVICNAWGVFDPSLEPPAVPYSNNPNHPVAEVLRLLEQQRADIVFAAGNCGQFCPNSRCNPEFSGPGRSINGANALREVLTVGAVRTDRLWLGYSGQGPGIVGMVEEKPDLCAPSQFSDEEDADPNTGTSAACGLAAGAVALLRTRSRPAAVDPAALRDILREEAEQPDGPAGWRDRTGHGILHVARTAGRLP
jgi:hypothetical protein